MYDVTVHCHCDSDTMKSYYLFIFAVPTLLYTIAKNYVLGAPRIVGGKFCNNSKYSFVVAISSGCGGSLISLHWVLTAGHCIHQTRIKQGKVYVHSGYNLSESHRQIRKAKMAFSYPKYNNTALYAYPPELRYDIGLILLDSPFDESPTLSVVTLPGRGFSTNCKTAKVLGTGSEGDVKNSTSILMPFTKRPLQCVDLKVATKEECIPTYKKSVIDDTIVCTLEKTWGKDACQGDSGGPLICEEENSMVQIGVVSYGIGCGLADKAATFTRVESYLDYIDEIMTKNKKYENNKSGKHINLLTNEGSNGISRNGYTFLLVIIVSLLWEHCYWK